MMVDLRVFDNDEANELFEFLDTIDVEYRKPYMRVRGGPGFGS